MPTRDIHSHAVVQHGPAEAYYNTMPDQKPHPVIRCLCGWVPPIIFDSWKDLGASFDGHIREALQSVQFEPKKKK